MSVSEDQSRKTLVARSFCMAASGYDDVAALQRSVGEILMSKRPQPQEIRCILDIGAGTGVFSAQLARHYPAARVIGLDIAEGMLLRARHRFAGSLVVGDAESLPFASHSVDLLFSNLAIQWCHSVEVAVLEFARVLRPGGWLLLSTFGPQTLRELRAAWACVDDYSHVNRFESLSVIEKALGATGFASIKLETALRAITYPGVLELMRELKGLGAHNLTTRRPRHLTGKGALTRMIQAYPKAQHSTADDVIEATYELIIGAAINCGVTDT